jgi:hypothetical protein
MGNAHECETRKSSVHYKTLLWLTSLMLNDESFSYPKCSVPAMNKIDNKNGNLSEKDQFQLITSRIINISTFKNRRKRLSLCETDMKAFTQNDTCINSREYVNSARKIFSTSREKKVFETLLGLDLPSTL